MQIGISKIKTTSFWNSIREVANGYLTKVLCHSTHSKLGLMNFAFALDWPFAVSVSIQLILSIGMTLQCHVFPNRNHLDLGSRYDNEFKGIDKNMKCN